MKERKKKEKKIITAPCLRMSPPPDSDSPGPAGSEAEAVGMQRPCPPWQGSSPSSTITHSIAMVTAWMQRAGFDEHICCQPHNQLQSRRSPPLSLLVSLRVCLLFSWALGKCMQAELWTRWLSPCANTAMHRRTPGALTCT